MAFGIDRFALGVVRDVFGVGWVAFGSGWVAFGTDRSGPEFRFEVVSEPIDLGTGGFKLGPGRLDIQLAHLRLEQVSTAVKVAGSTLKVYRSNLLIPCRCLC